MLYEFPVNPKTVPAIGDLIEGYAYMEGDQARWISTDPKPNWFLVYGCVTHVDRDCMQVQTFRRLIQVHGQFTGKVTRDNEAHVKRYGSCRIWVPLPLGTNSKGHLVNPPKSGFAVEVNAHPT